MNITNKCPKCDEITDKYMTIGGIKMACDCSNCFKSRKPMGKPYEFTSDMIREGRKQFKNELYQPYREGNFSKEYRDANPEISRGMVKAGVITQQQHKNAKNVWKGDVG